ncbi:uncharacterized protein LAESUDRAFT_748066 [Laetiporus sulphureus 93-53]|uniref:Uncharacterized protein n=1 Tax=Laetiporus sulphureus 93-53 TaxID=1314785 RepID=A0A165GCY4_9APHY|nr:uncharacterized protein LAESUDRAFT_748066 [Laetiporus sulphureus 93-53]KZT10177.1 hypothetical protein LAESUDRAFT_748066 [Laetiporus sulphureus 93-53]
MSAWYPSDAYHDRRTQHDVGKQEKAQAPPMHSHFLALCIRSDVTVIGRDVTDEAGFSNPAPAEGPSGQHRRAPEKWMEKQKSECCTSADEDIVEIAIAPFLSAPASGLGSLGARKTAFTACRRPNYLLYAHMYTHITGLLRLQCDRWRNAGRIYGTITKSGRRIEAKLEAQQRRRKTRAGDEVKLSRGSSGEGNRTAGLS